MNTQNLHTPFKRTVLSSTLLLALSTGPVAQAAQTAVYLSVNSSNGNFTMLDPAGGLVGGTNDVAFTWDGTLFDNSSDYTGTGSTSNATISSPTAFQGYYWAAKAVQIFGPGSYTFDTAAGPADPSNGPGNISMTVGASQLGAHMLFDWGAPDGGTSCGQVNCNIDVVVVWNKNGTYAPIDTSAPNPGNNSNTTVFMLASSDPDGDTVTGVPMVDGAFNAFNANFNFLGTLTQIDTTPDQFTFTDQTGVTTGQVQTSNAITVTGINAPAVIAVVGGEYEINTSGTWVTAPGNVVNSDTIKVRHTSAACSNQTTNTTLDIGGVTDTFTTTTIAVGPDKVPNAYTFTSQSGVGLNGLVVSGPIVIGGTDTASDISIVNGEYRINGGSWSNATASGAVPVGATVEVRHTSSSSYSTQVTTTLNIGDSSGACGSSMITGGFSSTTRAADTIPDPFTFTSLIDQTVSTVVTSNAITVSGVLDPTAISIANGEYEINNSGTWTTTAGVVNNGDSVRVRHTTYSGPGTNIVTTLSIGGVSGTFTSITAGTAVSGGNFTMLSPVNGIVGGTNDVVFNWNGTSMYTSVAQADAGGANAGICSDWPFFSNKWTAYQVKVYGPGTYTIDTADTLGGPGCPYTDKPTCASGGQYTVTVNAGQIMAHMKFAWSATQGIDVIDVWNTNQVFGPSTMYTGSAGTNSPSKAWDLMSSDWDGDGINGGKMIDGPFVGFSANFSLMSNGTTNNACNKGKGGAPVAYEVENPPLPKKAWGWCSISTVPVNPMERGDWWLVAGFLGWLAAVRRRLGRTNH